MSLPVFGSCQSYWYNYHNCMKWINYHYISYWKSRALAAENENRKLYSTLYNGLCGENGPFNQIPSYNMNYTGQIGSEYVPTNSHLPYPDEVESSDHTSFNASLPCSTSTDEENDDSENDEVYDGDSYSNDSYGTLHSSAEDSFEFQVDPAMMEFLKLSIQYKNSKEDKQLEPGVSHYGLFRAAESDEFIEECKFQHTGDNDETETETETEAETEAETETETETEAETETEQEHKEDTGNLENLCTFQPENWDNTMDEEKCIEMETCNTEEEENPVKKISSQVDPAMMEFLKLSTQYKNSKEEEQLEPGVSHYGLFRAAESDEFIEECKFQHTGDNDETETEQEHKEDTGNLENLCTSKPENWDNTMDEEKCIEMETCITEEEENPVKKISCQVDPAMMEFLKLSIHYKNSKEEEQLEPGVSHGLFRAAESDEFIEECKFRHTGDNDETETEQEHKEDTGNLENLCTFKPENWDNTMVEEKCIEMETCNTKEEKNPVKKISKSKKRRIAKRKREMLLRKKEEKKKNENIFGKLYSDDEEEEEEEEVNYSNSVFNSSYLSYLSDCHKNYVFHTEKNCKNGIMNKQKVLEDESKFYSGIRIDRKKEVNNEHKPLTYQMNTIGKETKRKGE